MDLQRWNHLEEEITETILSKRATIAIAVYSVTCKHPEDDLNDLLLAVLSVCSNISQHFEAADVKDRFSLRQRYEVVAGLSADIASIGNSSRTCADLVMHWKATDDVIFIASAP